MTRETMDYSINLDHQNKIIFYQHKGTIGKLDIGMVWDEFLKMKEFTELKYNLFSDYSEAKFKPNPGDIETISNLLASLKEILNGKKQALYVTEPMNTAMSIMFEAEVIKKVGFKIRIFSTRENAIKWLKEG